MSVVLALVFIGALAACGIESGTTSEVAIAGGERQVDRSALVPDSSTEVRVTGGDDGQRLGPDVLPTPVARAASPSDRQSQQSITAPVAPAAPAMQQTGAASVPDTPTQPAPATTERAVESAPPPSSARAASGSTAVQRDIEVPDTTLLTRDKPAVQSSGLDVTRLDPRVQAEIVTASAAYECQPGIDPECTEYESEADLVDVYAESASAAAEPESAPSNPEGIDCIGIAGEACADTSDAAIEVIEPVVETDTAPIDDNAPAEAVDCDVRPWGKGCTLPPPGPNDGADFIDETAGDADVIAGTSDGSAAGVGDSANGEGADGDSAARDAGSAQEDGGADEGVFVSQEVQDILLTPANAEVEPDSSAADDDETENEPDGAGHPGQKTTDE